MDGEGAMIEVVIRPVEPHDYPSIISVVDEWWGGRPMAAMLPKLFFVHFRSTSFAAVVDGEIVGFLIGFVSQTFPDQAYIHFVGVHPARRGAGLGRQLYEHFFATAGLSHGSLCHRSVESQLDCLPSMHGLLPARLRPFRRRRARRRGL